MDDLQDIGDSFLSQFSTIESEKVCLALSGGLDSMVLLHLMWTHLNDKYKIRAIHVNHNLNEGANDWSAFCEKQCNRLGIDLSIKSIHPENNGFGLEASARDERYQVIKEDLAQNELLLTAHHKDDQLETILFRIFRGTGVNGLRGIVHYKEEKSHTIFRPLIEYSRTELEEYAALNKIKWIEDDSNENISFDRNYIRNQIVPKIKDRWKDVQESTHRLSLIAAESHELLNELATDDLFNESDLSSVSISCFESKSIPRIKNMIRFLIEKNNMDMPSMHILNSGLADLIRDDKKTAEIKWSNFVIRRFKKKLYFLNVSVAMPFKPPEDISWSINQPIDLHYPIGSLEIDYMNGSGISLNKCSENLQIKFRKGGEKISLKTKKTPKTLKDFFNEKKILPWVRDKIPLIYDDQDLICIGDFWINDDYRAEKKERSFIILWNKNMRIS
tara:strand:- start:1044 stop:2378 length:1335 start_codon:yes stop_codon:yes gene_type:complete